MFALVVASRWCVDGHAIFASVAASLVARIIALTFALECSAFICIMTHNDSQDSNGDQSRGVNEKALSSIL